MKELLSQLCMLCWPYWLAALGIVCVMVAEAMEAKNAGK